MGTSPLRNPRVFSLLLGEVRSIHSTEGACFVGFPALFRGTASQCVQVQTKIVGRTGQNRQTVEEKRKRQVHKLYRGLPQNP